MPARGYTLLELLIVIAIIGIAAGVVSLSVRGNESRRLTEEGDRLAALFRMAQSEARVAGRPIRWRADLSGHPVLGGGPKAAPVAPELARERRRPFGIRRIAGPGLVFRRRGPRAAAAS